MDYAIPVDISYVKNIVERISPPSKKEIFTALDGACECIKDGENLPEELIAMLMGAIYLDLSMYLAPDTESQEFDLLGKIVLHGNEVYPEYSDTKQIMMEILVYLYETELINELGSIYKRLDSDIGKVIIFLLLCSEQPINKADALIMEQDVMNAWIDKAVKNNPIIDPKRRWAGVDE